jgi:hypothetical protein
MMLKIELTERSYPFNEISPNATIKYCGQEIIKDKQYYRYLINSKPFSHSLLYSTASCNSDRDIEMLLPIDMEKGSKAFLREANLQNACINQPAEIHYGEINKLNDQKATLLNYPNNIFYYLPKPFRSDELRFCFQVMSENQKIRTVDVIIDSSDLNFICRNRGKYIASFAFLPFTLVLDALMLPISLPLFFIWASGSGV